MTVIRLVTALLLCLLGMLLAIWSIIEHVNINFGVKNLPLCNISETISCGAVLGSEFATILGISLGAWGLFFYLTNFFIFLRRRSALRSDLQGDFLLVVHVCSVLFSLYLFAVSHYYIGVLCPICMGMYAVNLALFLTVLTEQSLRQCFSRLLSGLKGSGKAILSLLFEERRAGERAHLVSWFPITIILAAVLAIGYLVVVGGRR